MGEFEFRGPARPFPHVEAMRHPRRSTGGRTMLEQEFYEQFRDQGMDEFAANEMAREWANSSGEYDEDPWADREEETK